MYDVRCSSVCIYIYVLYIKWLATSTSSTRKVGARLGLDQKLRESTCNSALVLVREAEVVTLDHSSSI